MESETNLVKHNCQFCQNYRCEELGDSDYGGTYASEPSCSKYLDNNFETEENIPNFDRNIERKCCELDFWVVVEFDDELFEKLDNEMNTTGSFNETYELFKKKYVL